jgi:spermidine synthase
LALDGAIQCTEKDEFSYQEMISFLPLTVHPNPTSVLIIGGGDGGVAREVSKYPSVQKIVQCEIDAKVIEMSKKFLPFMAKGFDSPKLTLHVGDGFEFMGNHENEFDVIITDSSDPTEDGKKVLICYFCTIFEHNFTILKFRQVLLQVFSDPTTTVSARKH